MQRHQLWLDYVATFGEGSEGATGTEREAIERMSSQSMPIMQGD